MTDLLATIAAMRQRPDCREHSQDRTRALDALEIALAELDRLTALVCEADDASIERTIAAIAAALGVERA